MGEWVLICSLPPSSAVASEHGFELSNDLQSVALLSLPAGSFQLLAFQYFNSFSRLTLLAWLNTIYEQIENAVL